MYITDIRHLMEASQKMAEEMPSEARDMIGFLTQIIDITTIMLPNTLSSTAVRCNTKGCDGFIKSALRPDTEEIHWYCPMCEKEGLINNWQGTEWDQRNKK
jgi:hypothetical protein